MDRHPRVVGAFICLMILSAMAMILNFSVLRSQDTLYVTKMDLAKEIFSDTIERVVFVTADLKVYIFSTNEYGRVGAPTFQVYDYLKNEGVEIEDIGIITHNHFTPKRFTPVNNKTYHFFKEKGFRGLFSIYYPATKKVRIKDGN